MNTINIVKDFVKSEAEKPTSKYGHEAFESHFLPTVKHAEQLSKKYGGDTEIILIACWLHDIGSLVYGRKDHHLTSAQIAEEKLKKLNYPEEKIQHVKNCILNHRGSMDQKRESLEEKIVAEADVLSNFDDIAGLFQCALVHEGLTREEARISVKTKLTNKWNQLYFEESKKIIKAKYEAAMTLLS